MLALGQAGQPQKWVHEENLTCSLISLCFPAEGVGGRTCSALVMAQQQHGVFSTHSPTQDCPLSCDSSPGHVIPVTALCMAQTRARCCCLARKCLFPVPASRQGGRGCSHGGFTCAGRSRWVLGQTGDGDRSFRTSPQHKSASAPMPWGPSAASAAPFGSWIFIAGLPSDERLIIHPVIAQSYSELGLSQLLGNIFLATVPFSLREGFGRSAANSFKPRQLCPVMPFPSGML